MRVTYDPTVIFLTQEELEKLLKKENINHHGLTIHMQEDDGIQFVELFVIIRSSQRTIEMLIETGYYKHPEGEYELRIETKQQRYGKKKLSVSDIGYDRKDS